MIHALILAAAAHAAPPPSTPPLRSPPSAREVVELQLKADAGRTPALSAAEARRLYEGYLSGLGRAPAGDRAAGSSAREASATR